MPNSIGIVCKSYSLCDLHKYKYLWYIWVTTQSIQVTFKFGMQPLKSALYASSKQEADSRNVPGLIKN